MILFRFCLYSSAGEIRSFCHDLSQVGDCLHDSRKRISFEYLCCLRKSGSQVIAVLPVDHYLCTCHSFLGFSFFFFVFTLKAGRLFLSRATQPSISRSVGQSVVWSLGLSHFAFLSYLKFGMLDNNFYHYCPSLTHYCPCPTHYCPCPLHYCPCPTARDKGCRVYDLVSFLCLRI